MPKLPDRWLNYNNIGKQIPGSRFISMKVPLKKHFLENLEESKKFSCENVIEFATETGIKIGLIIDLTYTKKYYDPQFFIEQGIRYRKIFVPGRIIPSISVMSEFSECVNDFLDDNENNSSVIMVHCTHGLNRTGYMVCRFLIEEKKFDPEVAIKLFNEARGHDMERKNYINHLKALNNAVSTNCVNTKANICNEEQSPWKSNLPIFPKMNDYQNDEYVYHHYNYANYGYYSNGYYQNNLDHHNYYSSSSARNGYTECQSYNTHYNGTHETFFRQDNSSDKIERRNHTPYMRNDPYRWKR